MSPRDSLGELEHLILLAILRLGPNAYGVPILEDIEERSGRSVNPGSVYPTLDRLERKGLVRSRLGEVTHERGGRAKRYYAIEAAGLERLRSTRALFRAMSHGLEDVGNQPGAHGLQRRVFMQPIKHLYRTLGVLVMAREPLMSRHRGGILGKNAAFRGHDGDLYVAQ